MFRALLAAVSLTSLAACVAPDGSHAPYADNRPYGYNTGAPAGYATTTTTTYGQPYYQSYVTPPWQRPDLAHSNWDHRAP